MVSHRWHLVTESNRHGWGFTYDQILLTPGMKIAPGWLAVFKGLKLPVCLHHSMWKLVEDKGSVNQQQKRCPGSDLPCFLTASPQLKSGIFSIKQPLAEMFEKSIRSYPFHTATLLYKWFVVFVKTRVYLADCRDSGFYMADGMEWE